MNKNDYKIFHILFMLICWSFPFFSLSQKIDYALIEKGVFYYSAIQEPNKSDILYAHHINENKQNTNYVAASKNSYLPNCWDKTQAGDFIYISGFGGDKTVVTLKTIDIVEDGLSRVTFPNYDSLKVLIGEHKAWLRYIKFMEISTNSRPFSPLNGWLNLSKKMEKQNRIDDILSYVAYDIKHVKDSVFYIYLRNKKEFTIWQYSYPKYGNPNEHDQWEDLVTYSLDTITFRPFSIPTNRYILVPKTTHYKYESVTDLDFFKGDFKIIQQKENTFCINIDNGNIYYVGPDSIDKIGSIELSIYPSLLLGKPLFIEDRDKQEIICFSRVKRLNEKLPFPDIKCLKNRLVINQLYPGLSDL